VSRMNRPLQEPAQPSGGKRLQEHRSFHALDAPWPSRVYLGTE
jgi:hypothetical protein